MASNVGIARAYAEARSEKNIAACRDLLAENFTLKSPAGSAEGREAALRLLENPAISGRIENSMFISEDEYVVHMYDWVVDAPVRGSFSMAENLVIENGKVQSSQIIYDIAAFPDEIRKRLAA